MVQKVYYRLSKGHANLFTLYVYLFRIYFNIILTSIAIHSKWLLPFVPKSCTDMFKSLAVVQCSFFAIWRS